MGLIQGLLGMPRVRTWHAQNIAEFPIFEAPNILSNVHLLRSSERGRRENQLRQGSSVKGLNGI